MSHEISTNPIPVFASIHLGIQFEFVAGEKIKYMESRDRVTPSCLDVA